jgi:hypothetical protein
MGVDLLDLAIIQETPKSAHHPAIEVVVVLIRILVDQVEVPAEDPMT